MADHPLKARITEAMKDAMRAREKERLGAIRLILSELKKIEVDERIDGAGRFDAQRPGLQPAG